jgi:hypothetical protein
MPYKRRGKAVAIPSIAERQHDPRIALSTGSATVQCVNFPTHNLTPRIIEKAHADAEDFLLKVRRGLI